MSKTPNADRVNPGIKVTANQRVNEVQSTAGAGQQKSEEHYRKVIDRAFNRDGDKQGK
jgi:hypothetical protein